MKSSSSVIKSYLETIKWSYEEVNSTTLLTGVNCRIPFYDYAIPLHVITGSHWIVIRAYLQRGLLPDSKYAVISLISMLNSQCYDVRFSLVDDCVVLISDIPVFRLKLEAFVHSLKAILHYAAAIGPEVTTLATNSSVAALYYALETSPLAEPLDLVITPELQEFSFKISGNRLSD